MIHCCKGSKRRKIDSFGYIDSIEEEQYKMTEKVKVPDWYIEIDDWRCPKCKSKPVENEHDETDWIVKMHPHMKYLTAMDGGSVLCSNKKCRTHFHFCPKSRDYSMLAPVECGCLGFKY